MELFQTPLFIVIDLHHKQIIVITRRVRSAVSIRLFIVSCRIDPSLYRVVPDLFLSLCVVLVLLLLRPPTPTDDTPTPSLL